MNLYSHLYKAKKYLNPKSSEINIGVSVIIDQLQYIVSKVIMMVTGHCDVNYVGIYLI